MKLGIDAREIQDGSNGGVGRSLTDFLSYFASQKGPDRCVLFSTEKISKDFGPTVENVVLKGRASFLWDQVSLPKGISDAKIDVFYSPQSVAPPSKICWTVSAIPEVMSLAFQPYRNSLPLFFRAHDKTLGKKFAHQSDAILTCSEHSKNDIIDIYGVPHNKISVIPSSVDEMYKAENNFFVVDAARKFWGIKGRYILYFGEFTLHENAQCVLEAFNYLALRFPDVQLVMAGPKKNDYDALCTRIRELELNDRVVFPGQISPSDKPHVLYSGAEVFVFPSLYEAFGTAQMQAMACGVP
ncbi:MAG: glycosyltransferase family 4 protein, partial [Alphaproteobacteria bacterium]|nr:glycosyltransferase family 4 protein [Alphaproteobacteria bacterium]